jgi:hypothetical protein
MAFPHPFSPTTAASEKALTMIGAEGSQRRHKRSRSSSESHCSVRRFSPNLGCAKFSWEICTTYNIHIYIFRNIKINKYYIKHGWRVVIWHLDLELYRSTRIDHSIHLSYRIFPTCRQYPVILCQLLQHAVRVINVQCNYNIIRVCVCMYVCNVM